MDPIFRNWVMEATLEPTNLARLGNSEKLLEYIEKHRDIRIRKTDGSYRLRMPRDRYTALYDMAHEHTTAAERTVRVRCWQSEGEVQALLNGGVWGTTVGVPLSALGAAELTISSTWIVLFLAQARSAIKDILRRNNICLKLKGVDSGELLLHLTGPIDFVYYAQKLLRKEYTAVTEGLMQYKLATNQSDSMLDLVFEKLNPIVAIQRGIRIQCVFIIGQYDDSSHFYDMVSIVESEYIDEKSDKSIKPVLDRLIKERTKHYTLKHESNDKGNVRNEQRVPNTDGTSSNTKYSPASPTEQELQKAPDLYLTRNVYIHLKSQIEVRCCTEAVHNLQADCKVSVSNEGYVYFGGVQHAEAKANGLVLAKECIKITEGSDHNRAVRQDGSKSKENEIRITTPNNSPMVIDILGGASYWKQGSSKELEEMWGMCLHEAARAQKGSIALPLVGAGLDGLTMSEAATIACRAINQFGNEHADSKSCLKEVYIAEPTREVLSAVAEAFEKHIEDGSFIPRV